jgi:cytochrome P450
LVLLQALILAGTDTTTVTMTWSLSLLLNNREALKKAQQELDVQIGRERQVMQLTLATLLHAFEITTPSNEPVDMTKKVGLTNMKTTPLEVHLTPRLPTHVYA